MLEIILSILHFIRICHVCSKKTHYLFSAASGVCYHPLLLVFACFTKKRLRLSALILAGLLYLFSIEPTAEFFLKPLEDAYRPASLSDIRDL